MLIMQEASENFMLWKLGAGFSEVCSTCKGMYTIASPLEGHANVHTSLFCTRASVHTISWICVMFGVMHADLGVCECEIRNIPIPPCRASPSAYSALACKAAPHEGRTDKTKSVHTSACLRNKLHPCTMTQIFHVSWTRSGLTCAHNHATHTLYTGRAGQARNTINYKRY